MMTQRRNSFIYRTLSLLITFSFTLTTVFSPAYAQGINVLNLPQPGTMVTSSQAFVPVLLKGMTIHPDDPLRFDFIVDSGHTSFSSQELKTESERLVKYFLASMTVPRNDLWVNLSPFEGNRIIPDELGKTDLGRDMLAQDYLLKQLTASMIYPEKELGAQFWQEVYRKAEARFGTTDIPVNTFNKVWILPESATVYENGQTVYIVQSRLKVMLEEDYIALKVNGSSVVSIPSSAGERNTDDRIRNTNTEILKEIIIPAIEKEVNEGRNFAPLRQIYHSLILAKWYKEMVKNSLLSQIYIDQNKVAGVELADQTVKDRIYAQYIEAYKKGVFNYIKEDHDRLSRQTIPRKYFSGGITDADIAIERVEDSAQVASAVVGNNSRLEVAITPQQTSDGDNAMVASNFLGQKVDLETNDLYLGIQRLIQQQVEAQVAIPFSPTGELAAYYDDVDRGGFFQVQVNPRRDPKNRVVIKRGKQGCFLCRENMPDEEMGIEINDDFLIFVNPSPYERNHIVITAKEAEAENHQPQIISEKSQLNVAFDVLRRVSDSGAEDYNITFNSEGAANSSTHFHLQGFESFLPVTELPKTTSFQDGIEMGFVKNYPGQVIYLASTDRKKLTDKVFGITQSLNTAKDGSILPYNILFRLGENGVYQVYIFPRQVEAPSEDRAGLLSNKYGIMEMGGILITYEADEETGEGFFQSQGSEEWRRISRDLMEESLRAASFQNRNFLKHEVLGLKDEAALASSPVGDNYRLTMRASPPKRENDQAMLSAIAFDVKDTRSRNISLVGGKAASLQELASIPGIEVPDGFNVTTTIYNSYLESVNVIDLIGELDEWSVKWNQTENGSVGRREVEQKIQELSNKIQDRILNGVLSREHEVVVKEFYENLDGGQGERLVAVRSSATAEDMPNASFAGQYKTLLNQKGIDQVVQSIKEVWASTFSFNSINYRNKNNIKHGTIKMGVLILEMINPQSAGTMFSVDTETGAPMVSINNTYGLGEAEVSGIVTSDNWIVDPNNLTIIKRRLGDKRVKIVYDPESRKNIEIENDVDKRQRFAANEDTIKELARQMKVVSDYYSSSKEGVEYIDAEYVITNEGGILFTQARPETVWRQGKTSLVAIDKAKAMNFPIILEGGVTGSAGVKTGKVRVVSSVEEAEQKIQFGDVMVAPNTTNIWEHAMGLAGAIITEVGGTGNHTAVVSREQGKPAIVGSAKAMEILQKYEGMEVTIDATEKRIYLGQVPEEFQYFPDKVKPVYGGAYSQTLEESWEEATKTGQTYVDESGERWIGKPKVKVRKFLQEIYRANHQWIADRLKSPIRDKIVDGVYYVNFEDIFRWMGIIKSMSLVELEQLYSERIETVSEFLEKSESLDLTRESVEEWLDVFIRMNAFMGFSFNIYKITEGLLEEELKQKQVPEPYFSKVRQSMSSLLGETEATVRLREYAGLLETLRLPEQYRLVNALKSFRKFQNRDDLKEASPDYYTRLVNYVRNFKVMKNTDAVFSGQVPLNNLVNELLADLGANREIIIVEPTPEEYFPDDPHFQRIARLALLSEKIRQNSHHLKVRGQWKAAMVFQPLASYLIAKGEIDEYEQMFDHKPDWLVDKVAEYEQHNQSQDHDRESFSIRGYHIPNLRRDPRNGTSQKINHATTTMGRWQYTSTTLRNDTLILHNATRIESPYKKEFMINGENKQREIKLNIRQLTPQELDVVQDALVELGIDRDDVRVIRQDLASTDHRLYGLTTKGLIFIREDVLRLGNESSIREALDHLRLKPSGLEYAELKKIQYSGNLRDLITVLSHKTIKQKLLRRFLNANRISRLPDFTDNEQVKKTILRVITDELGEDSDQHEVQLHRVKNESDYYDRITREMVRNMSDFRETLRIVDQLSAENDSAMLSTVQKDRLRQAQELYGLSDVDREYTAQLWAQRLGGRSAAGGQLKIAFELDPEGFPVDDANFVLASMLKKSQREKLLGSYPYADIESDPGNAQAARQTVVTLNSMDGGIGESLNRIAFLREKAKKAGATREEIDAIQMSAKGTDLGYFVTIGGQEEFVSIAEAKVLQVIGFAQQGLYGQMKFQPLVNWQSKGSYEKLLKTVYLYDRLNGKKKPRTYREVLEEGGVEILPMLEQADLPWVEEATGDITLNMDMDDVRYFNLVKLLEEAGDPSAYRRELEKEGIDVLRLYRQILKENDTDIFSIVDLPSAEEKIRHIKFKPENKTSRYRQPGGHGQWGFLFLWKTIQDPAPDDGRSHIRVFYNGDNLNSRVNEHIAGWMARQKLPIVKLTTVATPIDKKGGKDGGKVVEIDGKKVIVPAQMEKADAVAVDQEEIFYSAGQADGLGEQGTQPFNTNVFYINESVLRDIFSELRQIEGYAELESLFRLITPTLIDKDAKKGKDGQRYIPLDGAIGTAMHNLNEFFQTTTDPRVKEILSKRGLDRILFFVDVPRTQFFTPVKNPFDMYLQSHSDYYRFNEKTFSLEDSEPGLIPPEASLAPEKKYWDEYQNLIDAFGRLKLRRLRSLAIEGRVKITDAELKGHVVILNKSQENIDLTQRAELADLKVAGHLVIDNKTIVINEDGSLSVSSTNFSTTTDGAMVSTVGGIDLNEIGMERQGSGSQIYFDSEQLQEIIDAGVTGFAPVIINLTPIHSLLPLLGLEPDDPADRREELYEVSSVN